MVCCSVLVIVCLAGLLRFRQEKNPLKLWVPPDSDFVRDTEWLTSTFKEGQRIESIIFTADDILEPQALFQLNEITKRIMNAQTNSTPKISWTDICFKYDFYFIFLNSLIYRFVKIYFQSQSSYYLWYHWT